MQGTDIPQVKDNFEARLPKWIEKLTSYTAASTPLQIDADILQLYAYAKEDWQKQSFGGLVGSYFETLVEAVGKYTESGTDLDTQKCFARVVHKNRITLIASVKTDYCGLEIIDGSLRIVFHPDKFATNTYHLSSDKLAQAIDSGESTSVLILPRLIFCFNSHDRRRSQSYTCRYGPRCADVSETEAPE
jgi:hypothetical protein